MFDLFGRIFYHGIQIFRRYVGLFSDRADRSIPRVRVFRAEK